MAVAPLRRARVGGAGKIKDAKGATVARYRWAASRLTGHIIDAGCNCGYGAAILADAGLAVTALDCWAEGLAFAREHWDRPTICWRREDFDLPVDLPAADAVVAFEVVEHLGEPRHLLRAARRAAPVLLLSVPNQDVWPHEARLWPVHRRHYTRAELDMVLRRCGWTVTAWWGQKGVASEVEPDVHGRTLVAECR